jgi:hypothetical protein
MSTEEDRERVHQSLPDAIPQEMRAAQIKLSDYLKTLGEAPPSVAVNSDQSGFTATVSREWLGVRFSLWENNWKVNWVHL